MGIKKLMIQISWVALISLIMAFSVYLGTNVYHGYQIRKEDDKQKKQMAEFFDYGSNTNDTHGKKL